MSDLSKLLPPMLFGDDLSNHILCLPEYSETYRNLPASERLMKLTDLYRIFVPNTMASEIYHKLYMMTAMSLKQKGTIESVQRLNSNFRWAHGGEFHGVATGATSATIIGNSGIGKTTCIQYAVDMLGPIIEIEKPYHKIIPVVMVSCPFDSNYKGLLCQILISIDEALGTNYYEKSQSSTMNAQQVLGLVCQVCHLYVGTLIIDEIQFLVEHRAGKQLYRMILQLINAANINVLLVGTNECLDFFQQAPQMARRTVGLQYGAMEYGDEFKNLCQVLFSYQYTKKPSTLTDSLTAWLYEHTGGISASLVSLIHDAQEIAILKGKEVLGIDTLTEAYNSRLKMLHGYISSSVTKLPQTSSVRETPPVVPEPHNEVELVEVDAAPHLTIAEMVKKAKNTGKDIVKILQEQVVVVEVVV